MWRGFHATSSVILRSKWDWGPGFNHPNRFASQGITSGWPTDCTDEPLILMVDRDEQSVHCPSTTSVVNSSASVLHL